MDVGGAASPEASSVSVRDCFTRVHTKNMEMPEDAELARRCIANCHMCGMGILLGYVVFHSDCCPYGCDKDLDIPSSAFLCCDCFCLHPRIQFSWGTLFSKIESGVLRLGFVYKPVGTNTKSARK